MAGVTGQTCSKYIDGQRGNKKSIKCGVDHASCQRCGKPRRRIRGAVRKEHDVSYVRALLRDDIGKRISTHK